MPNENVHIRENSEETESFLDENRSKFETDAAFLLRMMQRGERLSAKTVVQKYGIADRRLRDLENEGKCQKVWKLNEAGKRMYVEYYVPQVITPTKKAEIAWATEFLNKQQGTQLSLI